MKRHDMSEGSRLNMPCQGDPNCPKVHRHQCLHTTMLHLPLIHVLIGKEGAHWLPSPWAAALAMFRLDFGWHPQNLRNMRFRDLDTSLRSKSHSDCCFKMCQVLRHFSPTLCFVIGPGHPGPTHGGLSESV